MNEVNHQWQLARRPPGGMPVPDDFRWVEGQAAVPRADQMLTRTLYLSLDPYQWGRRRSGAEAVGEVCHGRTVSQVVDSRLAGYRAGDYVFNTNGWQRYGLSGAGISVFTYMFPRKLDPAVAPLSLAVGVLGMLGLTAYAGLVVQCRPRRGETVVVSAASGGVGQVVGQIGKLLGCRVVGIAGAAEKCDFVVRELGLDACVSHLDADLPQALARACPDGIDVYFENVGGVVFDAVLPLLNPHSRISLCGMISQYAKTDGGNARDAWMANGAEVFERQRVDVHELRVGNYVADYQDAFLHEMTDWLRDGRIKYREDIWEGLERAPEAFRAMLEGRNFGKTLVRVAADPTRPR